jgi:hypothetical protein
VESGKAARVCEVARQSWSGSLLGRGGGGGMHAVGVGGVTGCEAAVQRLPEFVGVDGVERVCGERRGLVSGRGRRACCKLMRPK